MVSADISRNLTITSTGRVYNMSGWTVAGDTTINAAGQNVEITADHDFTGSVTVIAENLTIHDINDITFDAITLTGNLTILATGDVTATGIVSVAGRTDIDAGSATGAVTFMNAANDFVGAVSIIQGGDVALRDVNGLIVGNSDIDGTLSITAGGHVTQNAALIVDGQTSITVAPTFDVSLASVSNDFGATVSVTADTLNLRDSNALALGIVTLTGDLTVASGGDLTGAQQIDVAGTTLLSTNGSDLSLTETTNSFGGLVTVNRVGNIDLAATATLNFAGATFGLDKDLALSTIGMLTLEGSVFATGDMSLTGQGVQVEDLSVGGNLSIDAGTGVLTQVADRTLRVTGTTSLSASDINLQNEGVLLGAVSVATTGNATLKARGDLILGASNIGGIFDLTVDGGITQTAAIAVSDAFNLTGNKAKDVDLSNAANDFGRVSVTDVKDLTIGEANTLTLGGTITGDLTITAGGAIDLDETTVAVNLAILASTGVTDSGTVSVSGATQITSTGAVTLDNDVVLTGSVAVDAVDLTLDAAADIELNAVTLSGNLDLATTGDIAQSELAADAIAVTGTTTLETGVDNKIVLRNAANSFGGLVTLTAAKGADLHTATALNLQGAVGVDGLRVSALTDVTLGALNITGGDLMIAARNTLSQTAGLTVSGETTLDLGATGAINLQNAATDFGGKLMISAASNVDLFDANALTLQGDMTGNLDVVTVAGLALGTTNVGGALTLTTGGDITQLTPDSALTVTKALTTAAALTPFLRVSVATIFSGTMVRSAVRVTVRSFGVPLRTIQISLGTASFPTDTVT
jgi:hypothetical protein